MASRKPHPTRERGYIFYHGRRVGHLAQHLAERIEQAADLDGDLLYAGGLFHDVGKGTEPHHLIGARLVEELLKPVLGPEQIEQIASIVANHNQRDCDDCSLAQRIVQDADILDHLGAQNVWLCIQYSASKKRSVAQMLEFYDSQDNAHYLKGCLHALHFEASRQEARRRLKIERDLMDALARQEQGRLCPKGSD
jgi:uncharacterized protein